MDLDLAALFRIEVAPLELIVRGSAIYWFLFLLFRFVLRRDTGSIATADILLLVIIADAAQNALAGGYKTITDGCILIATVAAWNYLLDWAAFRFPWVHRLVEAPPLLLIRNGRIQRANLRRELLTVDDLMAKLRQNGVENLADVKSAQMESDGDISVIRFDGRPTTPPRGDGFSSG